MNSQPATLTAFIDAAANRVAAAIADVRRTAAHERELRDAQFAVRMAELETRISAVSEIERRLADRLATLKDGEPGASVTVDDVESVIIREVEQRLASWPKPKDGTSVTMDDVTPMIDRIMEEKVIAAFADIHPAPELPDISAMIEASIADRLDVEDMERSIEDVVRAVVAALPPAEPGKDADLELVERLVNETVDRAVAAIPVPKDGRDGVDGKDADPDMVAELVNEKVLSAVAELPIPKDGVDGKDGSSVTLDDLAPIIEARIAEAVTLIPVPKDGRDGVDGKDGKDGVDGKDGARGERGFGLDVFDTALVDDGQTLQMIFAGGDTRETHEIPLPIGPAGRDGKDGEQGPPGALPIVKAWEDRVYYQGEVVSFDGSAYQASKDTGKAPTHADWTCIVAKGRDGEDGKSLNPTGLHDPEKVYDQLDIVMLNGASFVAKWDNPGECPGDGWNLLAAQGRQGKPGAKGDTGVGLSGLPGEPLKEAEIDENGLLRFINGDGSVIECDLYPVLSKIGG